MDSLSQDAPIENEHEPQPAQLLEQGTDAHLAGDADGAVDLLHRALLGFQRRDRPDQALQAAFRIAMVYGTTAQPALFNGWVGRYRSLLESSQDQLSGDVRQLATGYLGILKIHQAIMSGGFAGLEQLVGELLLIGRRVQHPDLLALGLVARGRAGIYAGNVAEGLDMLDECMTLVLAGDCSAIPHGLAWCACIEACQELGDFDRVRQWTEALARWRTAHRVSAYGGECSLHTGQILALRGDWGEAMHEFSYATSRFEANSQPHAAGSAERERGDLLLIRGELDAAQGAYQAAAEHGCDPLPGLARLWLAAGEPQAAVTSIRRGLEERALPAHRLALLPAAIEIELEAGQAQRAEALVGELDELAALTGCLGTQAAAAYAHAAVELARDDAAGSLPYARKAVQDFDQLGCPYQRARARVLLARAVYRLGDERSFAIELRAAVEGFGRLGAGPEQEAAAALLHEASSTAPHPAGLSERELQVLALVAGGQGNRQIAAQLCLSEKTVARHLSNIFSKLDVTSRTAAAAWAYAHDLA